jgi:hypothetical protein
MVWEEPVEDFHVEEEPKIEIYIGKPVVLTEEGDEIVETYENDDGQVVDHDNEYEEEPEDEVNSDYENEMVYEPIESDEGEEEVDDEIIVFFSDDDMYGTVMNEEVPDEVISDWYDELFDDDAVEVWPESVSFYELEEPLEELSKEDVVTIERMGGGN